ncbi:MAG: hypothetical protein ABW196_08695 [Solirubrobacterales bacterium]
MTAYWTKDRIIAAIRKHTAEHGHPPKASDWTKGGTMEHPSAAHVEGVCGSWSGAVEAAAMTGTADADIERQRKAEQKRPMTVDLLDTRMTAVFDAGTAVLDREDGAAPSLRQSLIDLAAVAGALADDLPPPDQWAIDAAREAEREAKRQRWRVKRRANGLAA